MKFFFVIVTMVLLSCWRSDWFSVQARSASSMPFPKFKDVREALVFLRTYPTITTQGVPLELLAKKLGMGAGSLETHIKADPHLTAAQMHLEGSSTIVIFGTGATPHEQVNNFMTTIPPARFKEGVPIAEVEANVRYKQDDWSSNQLRQSIGLHIDREKFVMHVLGEKRRIFLKGDAPPQQVDTYLGSMTKKKLEEGVSLAQIADNVGYLLDSWSERSAHQSISYYLNKDKYAMHPLYIDGVREHKVYPKRATPPKQLERCLQKIHPVMLMLGVPSAQIAADVNYTCKLSSINARKSIAKHLDKETYSLRAIQVKGERIVLIASQEVPGAKVFMAGVLVDDKLKAELRRNYSLVDEYLDKLGYTRKFVGIGGEYQEFILYKDDTPHNQINSYLDNLDPQRLKQGVPIEEIANNIVKYGREDWPQEDFLQSISYYLDRDKYATSFIIAGDEVKTVIFAKDFTPRMQLLSYLDSLDRELLQHQGLSLKQISHAVSYWQYHQAQEEFFRAMRWRTLEGYVVRWAKRSKGKGKDKDMPKARGEGRGRPKGSSKSRDDDVYQDVDSDTGKRKRELRIFIE